MGGRPEVRLGDVSRPHGDKNSYHDVWHGNLVILVMTNVAESEVMIGRSCWNDWSLCVLGPVCTLVKDINTANLSSNFVT